LNSGELESIGALIERRLLIERRVVAHEIQHQFRMHELEHHSSRRNPASRLFHLSPLVTIGALSLSLFAGHVSADATDLAPCEEHVEQAAVYCQCMKDLRAEMLERSPEEEGAEGAEVDGEAA
jgi:hypothetical protein